MKYFNFKGYSKRYEFLFTINHRGLVHPRFSHTYQFFTSINFSLLIYLYHTTYAFGCRTQLNQIWVMFYWSRTLPILVWFWQSFHFASIFLRKQVLKKSIGYQLFIENLQVPCQSLPKRNHFL